MSFEEVDPRLNAHEVSRTDARTVIVAFNCAPCEEPDVFRGNSRPSVPLQEEQDPTEAKDPFPARAVSLSERPRRCLSERFPIRATNTREPGSEFPVASSVTRPSTELKRDSVCLSAKSSPSNTNPHPPLEAGGSPDVMKVRADWKSALSVPKRFDMSNCHNSLMIATRSLRAPLLRLKARGFNHPRWGH